MKRRFISVFVCGLFMSLPSYASELSKGPLRIQSPEKLSDISGQWLSVAGGCVDLGQRNLHIFMRNLGIRRESLDIEGSRFLNKVTKKFSEEELSVGRGTIAVHSLQPVFIADLLASDITHGYGDETHFRRVFEDVQAFGIQFFIVNSEYLMTVPKVSGSFCNQYAGSSYSVFWVRQEVYAF